ncbi:MAG: valine--pyruvate transaminase [Anaerolineae bacterium]
MLYSKFGQKFTGASGILQLMDDLGEAMAGDEQMLMLGGGNPGHIPQVEACFRERMRSILDNGDEFERMIGNYNPSQGQKAFNEALAALLNQQYDWKVRPENIAITNGSQTTFFFLFNLFAGAFENGMHKKILLPLAPEYIGYTDVGISDDFFIASRPEIEYLDEHTFKYHVDFDAVTITDQVGAICVSRPTNPTGNVLTDAEIETLYQLARANNIPFIIDSAYGLPFPSIIFTEATPRWDEHMIVCMSLSKLGLPSVRTGIVIANEEVIKTISAMNAVITLAPGGFGTTLVLDLVRSGEIISLSQKVIRPYYQQKAEQAVALLHQALEGVDFYIHKPEGAIFLWVWFRDMPITSQELYERLKRRGALVVPGHHFFPGLQEPWRHKHECIRMTYSQDEAVVREGVRLIGQEVKKAYG